MYTEYWISLGSNVNPSVKLTVMSNIQVYLHIEKITHRNKTKTSTELKEEAVLSTLNVMVNSLNSREILQLQLLYCRADIL